MESAGLDSEDNYHPYSTKHPDILHYSVGKRLSNSGPYWATRSSKKDYHFEGYEPTTGYAYPHYNYLTSWPKRCIEDPFNGQIICNERNFIGPDYKNPFYTGENLVDPNEPAIGSAEERNLYTDYIASNQTLPVNCPYVEKTANTDCESKGSSGKAVGIKQPPDEISNINANNDPVYKMPTHVATKETPVDSINKKREDFKYERQGGIIYKRSKNIARIENQQPDNTYQEEQWTVKGFSNNLLKNKTYLLFVVVCFVLICFLIERMSTL